MREQFIVFNLASYIEKIVTMTVETDRKFHFFVFRIPNNFLNSLRYCCMKTLNLIDTVHSRSSVRSNLHKCKLS